MTQATIPTSRNTAWGFFGTMKQQAADTSPETAWNIAMISISDATGATLDETRTFLDSRHGRHFADDASSNLLDGSDLITAITAATRRWMGWTISASTSRDTGIPQGMAYLTGFVEHANIEADAATE
jgi:hypothetical protein